MSDDRDFQLSRVRRQALGGYKPDSRHPACMSDTKNKALCITERTEICSPSIF